MEYTKEQKAVIDSRVPRLVVDSLAGSGKTEVCAHRLVSISNDGELPTVLCYTKSARAQIARRAVQNGLSVNISTVHSKAVKTVLGAYRARGLRPPRISDGVPEAREVLRRCGFQMSTAEINAVLRASVSSWSNSDLLFDVPATMNYDLVAELAGLYAEYKFKHDVLDFDDVAVLASTLVDPAPGEVLVDEAQDVSPAQMAFISALTGDNRLVLVGDPNQCIYSFSGVDSRLFAGLDGFDRLSLSKSFRSGSNIVAIANQISSLPLVPARSGGLVSMFDNSLESLAGWCAPGSAVLCRSKYECSKVADFLESAGFCVNRAWECGFSNDPDDVVVSTVHSSKGSEWSRVAVLSLCSAGFFGFDPADDEKRVFYVALTRSRDELFLGSIDGSLPWGVSI